MPKGFPSDCTPSLAAAWQGRNAFREQGTQAECSEDGEKTRPPVAVEPCCWDGTGSAARLGTSLATSSRKLSSWGSADFLSRFESEVASLARAALARVRRLTPPAYELVYDAYNALAIGFSSSERWASISFMWRFTLATSTSAFPLAARSPTQITGCSEAVRGFDTFRFECGLSRATHWPC